MPLRELALPLTIGEVDEAFPIPLGDVVLASSQMVGDSTLEIALTGFEHLPGDEAGRSQFLVNRIDFDAGLKFTFRICIFSGSPFA